MKELNWNATIDTILSVCLQTLDCIVARGNLKPLIPFRENIVLPLSIVFGCLLATYNSCRAIRILSMYSYLFSLLKRGTESLCSSSMHISLIDHFYC